MIGIYKITNPNGKIYIGQSKNIELRFNFYLKLHCKNQPRIYNSLLKYGVDNHIFEIITLCYEEQLNEFERDFQEAYNVIGRNGLNCKLTETNSLKSIFSEELRAKISKGKKGLKASIEARDKMSKTRRRRPVIDLISNIIYSSPIEVSELFDIKHRTLCGYLDGSRTNKTNFKYV